MNTLFLNPPPTHFVYIPAILLLGCVIGFVLGRIAGIKEGQANFLGGEVGHEDDDLIWALDVYAKLLWDPSGALY